MSKNPVEFEDLEPFSPIQVEVFNSFEDALRRFKSSVQKSKILSLYKEKRQYEKPSAKKRRKKREMLERKRITELREKQMINGEWDRRQQKKDQKYNRRNRSNSDELL